MRCSFTFLIQLFTNEFSATSISSIYPNPSKGTVYFITKSNEKSIIEIYNPLGILMEERSVEGGSVDMQGYACGLYILHLKSEGNNSYHRIVVEK